MNVPGNIKAEKKENAASAKQNQEVITGGDFKRMVAGAYSEFLLEYENINALSGAGKKPGTNVLRTLGSSVMPFADVKDDSIGGLANRVASAAVLGARGNAGVVLAELFRGLAKGLSGKYSASSSVFGKAFQYGILYAQRVLPSGEGERPIIALAKAVAKGAYNAVRANLPISEILTAALEAGERAKPTVGEHDAGACIMFTFLAGCLKGLDGNFVSPAVSLSLGLGVHRDMPDPRDDLVHPYCMNFSVQNAKADVPEFEKALHDVGSLAIVMPEESELGVHIHTNHPGKVVEQVLGWGKLSAIEITNMAEPHALKPHGALRPVAALAVAKDSEEAQLLTHCGASLIIAGSEDDCPSVGELVGAAHSDMASSYVLVAGHQDFWLVFGQAKRILGARVELVLCADTEEQERALKAFDAGSTAAANAKMMKAARNR